MANEEDDPIIQEIDVYLAKSLSEKLYLFQYPVRPASMTYDDVTHLSAKIKPKQQKVELEMAIDTLNPNYCRSKGEQIALNVDGTCTDETSTYSSCWKCKEAEGTFFHLWWTCPRVKAFWEMIYNELKKVFKYTFPKKPEAFLLGIVGQNVLKNDRTFFMYATTAARILIAKYWKTQDLPTLEEWHMQLMDYMELDEMTGRIRDLGEETTEENWKKFKDYLQKHYKLFDCQ